MNQGVRGSLHVEIKLMFVRDENIAKNIQSTMVQFFSSTALPPMYSIKHVFGYVEELLDFKRQDRDDADNMILI